MGKEGVCHICGKYGPLSFEHVPPKSAFYKTSLIELSAEDALLLGPDDVAKGRHIQRMGGYTLCGRCNNITGQWYGAAFAHFCYQGMELLLKSDGKGSLHYPFMIYPLRVFKQIVTMFFSINAPGFGRGDELVKFVLNKNWRWLSGKYRFYMYLCEGPRFRKIGNVVKGELFSTRMAYLSELSYYPFGFLMTDSTTIPDQRLFPINHFKDYQYDDLRQIFLKPVKLETHMVLPADYRTKKELKTDFERNTGLLKE